MTRVLEINELDHLGTVLTPTVAEGRALQRARHRLGLEWRPEGMVRVYSAGNVGTIRLSPDLTVSITTKLPIASLLLLASWAYQTLPLPESLGEAVFDSAEPLFALLALLLAASVEELLACGLRRGYVLIEDQLPYVRGRLRFHQARASTHAGLIPCEFADLLADTPENRVLRATLEMLSTRRLLPGLRSRIDQLRPHFSQVTLMRPDRQLLAACRITRLNQHYAATLELCRLLIEELGIESTNGAMTGPAYFFPMEKVFEHAVTNYLRSHFPRVAAQSGRSYHSTVGTPPAALSFAADIVIGSPPRLIIDTKYASPEIRNQYGGWSFHNAHVYQVAFYALSLGCPAVLVYPRTGRDIDLTFDAEGVKISILTLGLQAPGGEGLEAFRRAVQYRLMA